MDFRDAIRGNGAALAAIIAVLALSLFVFNSPQQSPSGFATLPITNGLSHYWALDEASGTVANNSAGAINGTANNATWVPGKIGNGIFFNGTGSSVSFGDLDITGNHTIGFWMNASTLPSGWHTLLAKPDSYAFEFSGTTLYYRVGAGSVTTPYTSTGQWRYITGTFNNGALALYIDGVEQATASGVAMVTNNNTLRAGSWDGSGEYFNGTMDEIAIYNRALTPTEIQTLAAFAGGPVNGSCGSAATTYNTGNAFPGTGALCANGTSSPASPTLGTT